VSPDRQCAAFKVSGRVQGVFFRAGTRREAQRLGLTGWVRNTDAGGVELVACGPAVALAALEEWLLQGPPDAQVLQVLRFDAAPIESTEFVVRY
jgi:acylphosphatase